MFCFCWNASVTGAFVLVCRDGFDTLRFPAVSGVEMKIYKRSLQALLSFPTSCTGVSFHVSATLM